ncbi:hypothetical protein ACB092_04G095700 [Castanea dentata]
MTKPPQPNQSLSYTLPHPYSDPSRHTSPWLQVATTSTTNNTKSLSPPSFSTPKSIPLKLSKTLTPSALAPPQSLHTMQQAKPLDMNGLGFRREGIQASKAELVNVEEVKGKSVIRRGRDEFGEERKGDKLICMNCSYIYHQSCLLPWLQKNNTYPNCLCKLDQQ